MEPNIRAWAGHQSGRCFGDGGGGRMAVSRSSTRNPVISPSSVLLAGGVAHRVLGSASQCSQQSPSDARSVFPRRFAASLLRQTACVGSAGRFAPAKHGASPRLAHNALWASPFGGRVARFSVSQSVSGFAFALFLSGGGSDGLGRWWARLKDYFWHGLVSWQSMALAVPGC